MASRARVYEQQGGGPRKQHDRFHEADRGANRCIGIKCVYHMKQPS